MASPDSNILLLSAGRRVELAQAFKAEIKNRSLTSKLYATDLKPEFSAACHVVDDAFTAPRVTEAGYFEFLLDLCRRQNVGLVIPTIDTELLGLAQYREKFGAFGIELVISDESLVDLCRNKSSTTKLFGEIGIDTPIIYDKNALEFPCFAKPYDGSRSIGAFHIPSSKSVTQEILADPKLIFMEYIDGSYQEYTVDAYYDRRGVLKCLVPRLRMEVRDGEISKGVTRKDYVYHYLKDRLSHIRGARGCLTMQLFTKNDGSRYAALEINARFGGGFPLSYAAGANYPGWLIDEYLLGKSVDAFEGWESDLLMLRYDAKVLVRAGA